MLLLLKENQYIAFFHCALPFECQVQASNTVLCN